MTRFFDVFLSLLAIIVLFPFMIPIMIVLKLTGEHYVFYRQVRIGRRGEPFNLYKFATMLLDSPNLPGGLYTSKNDPRMLPLGPFLRKTKINELPQLLNILCGQMSVVGYRPTVPEHFEGYPAEAKQKLMKIRPGLTGLGSVVFRNEEEILQNFDDKKVFHQEVIAPYKASLECWYADNRTLSTYFKLIFLTVLAVAGCGNDMTRKLFPDMPPVPEELADFITK